MYWILLISIALSLYPLFTLILYFWISLIDRGQNFKISRLLIGCSVFTINTLIGCILNTSLDISIRLN